MTVLFDHSCSGVLSHLHKNHARSILDVLVPSPPARYNIHALGDTVVLLYPATEKWNYTYSYILWLLTQDQRRTEDNNSAEVDSGQLFSTWGTIFTGA